MMLAGDRGEKYLKLYEISKQVSFDGRNEDFQSTGNSEELKEISLKDRQPRQN